MKKVGFIIIIIGAVLTIYTAVTYFTKEKVVDLGKIEITANKAHHLRWSPLIGVGVMAVGGVVLWQGLKK